MNYHFRLHKEDIGYWAECCELEGCVTQGDTLEEIYAACEEALDVYLYEPDNSERIVPLPDKTLDGRENIIQVARLEDSGRQDRVKTERHMLLSAVNA
ncbi:MAG: hypothetical protein Pg6C_12540 [Treponemataceae bacterium]|nr:MAG: hypothetical protein Pg6C_12540 [Treponemataceae bacterium]